MPVRNDSKSMGRLRSGIVSQKVITTLTITAVCIVSLILVAAWHIKVQLTVDAEGSVHPKEPSAVQSHSAGLIAQVYVQNNSTVESGQPICAIAQNREFRHLGEAIVHLKAARGSIESLADTSSNVDSRQGDTVLKCINQATSSVLQITKMVEDIDSSRSVFGYPVYSDTIFSPASGTIVLYNSLAPGRFISDGEALGDIEHVGEVEAVLSVDGTKSGRINTGQKVIVTTPDATTHCGRVIQILGMVSPTNSRAKPTCILKVGGFENAIEISGNRGLPDQSGIPVKAKIVITEGKRIITLFTEAAFRKTVRGHPGE